MVTSFYYVVARALLIFARSNPPLDEEIASSEKTPSSQ